MAATLMLVPLAVLAQEVPSASLSPADSKPHDPDGGNSFFLEIAPGEVGTGRARLVNPSDSPLNIKLYIRDVAYTDDAAPEIVDGEQTDVGAWASFNEQEITLAGREQRIVEFSITPPQGAEPGDHIGAVVAESEPSGGSIRVVRRTAVRIFVTIPGDARRSFEISSVRSDLDSFLFPDNVTAEVRLENTGRIRLRPSLSIGSEQASGSEVLLSRTSELYSAELNIPWYGGLIRMPVVATADQGLTRRVNHSKFVIPWGLIILLATAAGAIFLLKKYWWDKRVSRVASLQADLRRIEALVARRPGLEPGEVPDIDDEQEEMHAILAGIKRARRTGSQPSLGRLALALHETTGDALEYLVEALEKAEGPAREDLLAAASSYGPAALANEKGVSRLETETATELMLRASGAEPKPNGSSMPKKPTVKKTPKKPRAKSDPKPRKKQSPQRSSRKKTQRIRPDRRSPK
ncbi:MAG: DUF916 domain-containing protein [Actinobacteria bacterium]|nr:DUF916 domain-containing protein [Actinomycetota bacterium]